MNGMTANAYEKNDHSDVVICHICYGLYASGIILFFTPIIGVIMNYIKRSSATSECLSHHNWMIKTFWISMIVSMIELMILFELVMIPFTVWIDWIFAFPVGIAFVTVVIVFVFIAFLVWYIYRIVKGWLRLYARKSIG